MEYVKNDPVILQFMFDFLCCLFFCFCFCFSHIALGKSFHFDSLRDYHYIAEKEINCRK